MNQASNGSAAVDDYIASFPDETRAALDAVRAILKQAIPDAEEAISYRVPTLKLAGRYVIYFAAHQGHIGIYPAPAGDATFEAAIARYRSGRATLRFPLDQPVPTDLIEWIGRVALLNHMEREENRKDRRARR